MARKFFFCAATLILNGLGGPGHFKTIFISLKKELCKKEKCKFLTLKNSGFFFVFFLPATSSKSYLKSLGGSE